MKRRYALLIVLVLLLGWNALIKLALWVVTPDAESYRLLVFSDGGIIGRWIGAFWLTGWLMYRAGLFKTAVF
jgi:hypothetical protein